MQEVCKGRPAEWPQFSEHEIYEPAFYSTVVQDWSTSLLTAQELGDAEATPGLDLAHMIDQPRNVTDPIECLMVSAIRI